MSRPLIAAALALHAWHRRVCRPGRAPSHAEREELAAIERAVRAAATGAVDAAPPWDRLRLALLACEEAKVPARDVLQIAYGGFRLATYAERN